ncbi:prepilin-type N-terminal cleavage/methylation domain-containing protein [Patescibacteria group bacterium]|nr:prepilin-type N-terminal cleavage/methylation domain-containing protein [Patescibacteria group bacterium]MBU4162249.1 prepilin-type N-terminal cleavage/methylation domain-containing protein [Patescibacteria group bacterium]
MINNNGFTLIEMLITVSVVSVGIVGVFMSVQQGIIAIDYANSRFTAALLAQEGVEIIKSIRDTNLLEYNYVSTGTAWNEGIRTGDIEAQYTDPQLTEPAMTQPICSPSCDPDDIRFLKKSITGFYNYDTGDDSRFKRLIHIESPNADQMDATITVFWNKRGGGYYSISLLQHLYNWW